MKGWRDSQNVEGGPGHHATPPEQCIFDFYDFRFMQGVRLSNRTIMLNAKMYI